MDLILIFLLGFLTGCSITCFIIGFYLLHKSKTITNKP